MPEGTNPLTPFPFQEEAIAKGTENNLLCADACGLGKTLMGIEIARNIAQEREGPTIVVCTKGARLQWKNAIIKQCDPIEVLVLDRISDFPSERINSRTPGVWIVIHFAALRKVKSKSPIARVMYSTIIVDEAHRIKNRKTQQAKGVKKLSAFRKVALTATEMERSPEDLWSILNFLYPTTWSAYYGFTAKYVEYEEHPYFKWKKAVGAKNVERLAAEIAPVYIKRRKEDVKDDLPPLLEERVPVQASKRMLTVLSKLRKADDILVDIDDKELLIPNVLANIMTRRQVASHGLDLVRSDKIDWVVDYIHDNPNASVAVFTVFRKTAEKVSKLIGGALVMGGIDVGDLSQTKPKYIVGTIKKLGESYDLPWVDVAVFIDSDWSTTAMTQAKDRIHRINITSPKVAYYLYYPDTVDQLVFDALDGKWSTLDIVHEYLRNYT